MAEETNTIPGKIKRFLNRFSTSRVIFLAAVVILIIVVIIIIINLVSANNYEVLYSNLSGKDPVLIIEKLKEKNVSYRLMDNDTTIKVPGNQVEELRIQLAAKGLPEAGGSGVEIFDKTSFSSSDFLQNVKYIRAIEDELAGKIIALLEPYVGPGKVRAEVKLMLNFDKVETTEETVDPENTAKISEESETTSSSGTGPTGGIRGGSSKIGTPGSGSKYTTSTAPPKSKSEKSVVSYEISKKITRLTKPVGEIQRISAAVVVDDAVDILLQDGELIKQPRKRTPEELEAIKKIAGAAVGFNQQRGDVIEVANLPFDTSAETVSQYYHKKQKSEDLINSLIKYTAFGLGFLLLFLVVLKPLGRKLGEIIRESRFPRGEEVETPKLDREKLSALLEARDKSDIEQELLEKYRIPKSTRKKSIIRDRVKKFASENTDETASLIKSFLIRD